MLFASRLLLPLLVFFSILPGFLAIANDTERPRRPAVTAQASHAPTAAQQTSASSTAARPTRRAQSYFLFLQARQLEADGDVEGAIKLYKQAADTDPASGDILAELAAVYARQDRPREAIAAAEEALKRAPDTTEAHFVLGSIYAAYAQSEEPIATRSGRAAASNYASKAIEHLEAVQRARGNTTDPGVMLTLGRMYLRVGAYDKAIAALTRFTEQEGNAVESVALLAEAYAESGKTDQAIDLLRRASATDPSFFPALADLYERTGRWQEAADAYRQASQAGSNSAEVKKRWAQALLNSDRAGDPAKARELLQQVLEAAPSDTRAMYLLAQAERQLSDFSAAEATACKLIAADPDGVSGAFALAQVYEQRHQPRKVVDTLQPVVERVAAQPPSGRVVDVGSLLLHLAFAYIDLDQPDRAISALDRARQALPGNPTVAAALVQAQLAARRYPAALESAERAVQQFPNDTRLMRLQAEALSRNGQFDRGVDVLQRAQQDDPADVSNYIALAELLMNGERTDRAAAVLQRAQQKFPDDLNVLFELGAVRERQKRWTEAEDAFRKVIARDPRHAQALNYLGYMFADRGVRLNEAVEYIRRALDVEPNNPAYLDSLGWAYFKMNRLDLAESNLREAASQRSSDSAVQEHYGDVLMKLGRRNEAIAAWRRALAGDRQDIDAPTIEAKIRTASQKAAKK